MEPELWGVMGVLYHDNGGLCSDGAVANSGETLGTSALAGSAKAAVWDSFTVRMSPPFNGVMNVPLSEVFSTLPIRIECIQGFSSDGSLHSCDFSGGRCK